MVDTPSSKQYRTTKNGNEARQDAAIEALRRDNDTVHQRLETGLYEVKHIIGKYVFAGRIFWGFVGTVTLTVGSIGVWLSVRGEDRLDELELWQAEHTIACELDHAALRVKTDANEKLIGELRRRHGLDGSGKD